MSNEVEQQQPAPEAELDELATLKARADLMGIRYNPKISVEKLKLKIEGKLSDIEEVKPVPMATLTKKDELSEAEFDAEQATLRRSNAGKLVRVRVTCMNPNKKDWDGEIISVGSAKIGTFKKFVKFNADDGWHIPFIIYEYLKEKKCSVFYTVNDERGQKIRKARLVNEFSLEVLPALTDAELKDLAIKQAMEAGNAA